MLLMEEKSVNHLTCMKHVIAGFLKHQQYVSTVIFQQPGNLGYTAIPTALQGLHFVFLIGLFPVANPNFSTSSFQFYSCLGIMEEVVCRTKFKINLFQEMGGF